MIERKLSQEEIDELFLFCERHYVKYYDLQLELVDHLAESIELQFRNGNSISFDNALKNIFKDFSVFGFSKIKTARERALQKGYEDLFWQQTLDYLKMPKVLLTGAAVSVLFSFISFAHNPGNFIFSYFLAILFFLIYYRYRLFPTKYRIKSFGGKSFMAISYLESRQLLAATAMQCPFIVFQLSQIQHIQILNRYWLALPVSLTIVIFTITLYLSLIVIPIKIREHLKEQFPQFIKS